MTFTKRASVHNVVETLAGNYLRGKSAPLELAVITLLSGGHLLLEDLPGLGKTTLALALARALGLSFGRIQCTSDLLPSDITGLSILDRKENRFRFVPGPIFNNVVLVDEVNRAMPKTQSAMLEAMEERRVTVEGTTYPLPDPFLVIATQNPLEQVGTYPLPESQMDRFLTATGIGYPPEGIEKSILRGGSLREEIGTIQPLLSTEDILEARLEMRERVYLSDRIVDYLYRLVAATREHPYIVSGISTRGAIGLADAARSAAYLAGRDHVVPEDAQKIVIPVAAHRLMLRAEYQSIPKVEVLKSILESEPVPRL